MSNADAVEVVNGNGVAGADSTSTDHGEKEGASRTREVETDRVDALSAARMKQADNADEKRKSDQALVERYDARVKEVRRIGGRVRSERLRRNITDHSQGTCYTLPTLARAMWVCLFVFSTVRSPSQRRSIICHVMSPLSRCTFGSFFRRFRL